MEASTKPTLPSLGEVVGKYRLEAVLGRGGMGTVFKVEHVNMGKTMALKMLTAARFDDEAQRRFKLEAKLAAQLSHPNIVNITDFDIDLGRPYLVMDYLKGKSLERILDKEGVLALDRFEKIILQACTALGYAHKNGVVHRDVKTSNLMLTERGGEKDVLVIVDFGLIKVLTDDIADKPAPSDGQPVAEPLKIDQRLTAADAVVGSPLFMSPEQCQSSKVDHRTDIYALGCVMYNCLAGKLPFQGDDPRHTFYMHVFEPPRAFSEVNPSNKVPPDLEKVVMKALAKNPDERQQDMQQLADEITRALHKKSKLDDVDLSQLSNESSLLNPVRINELKTAPSKKLVWIGVGIIALALIAIYIFCAIQLNHEQSEPKQTIYQQ